MKFPIVSINFNRMRKRSLSNKPQFSAVVRDYLEVLDQAYEVAKKYNQQAGVIALMTHEYAIYSAESPSSKVLSYDEHRYLKTMLAKFSLNHPGCVVVFPHAFKKTYTGVEKTIKFNKLLDRFDTDKSQAQTTDEYDDVLDFQQKIVDEPLKSEMTVVRNVCYLYASGKVTAKVDKRVPCFEYTLPNSKRVRPSFRQGHTLFQPGDSSEPIPFINESGDTKHLAIEICADYALGFQKSHTKASSPDVDYHLVVSDSTPVNHANCVGQYNIIADSFEGTHLLVNPSGLEDCPKVFELTPTLKSDGIEYRVHAVSPTILEKPSSMDIRLG